VPYVLQDHSKSLFKHRESEGSVNIATGCGLDGRDSIPGKGKKIFSSPKSRPALGPTQPPIEWAPEALSPGLKWPGREADHLPPSSAEVKNGGAIPLLPPRSFHLYGIRKFNTISQKRATEICFRAGVPYSLFWWHFLTKVVYVYIMSSLRAIRPAHLIPLVLFTLISEEYKLWSSLLRDFPYSPLTAYLYGPKSLQSFVLQLRTIGFCTGCFGRLCNKLPISRQICFSTFTVAVGVGPILISVWKL
jgi:hypothetical protein